MPRNHKKYVRKIKKQKYKHKKRKGLFLFLIFLIFIGTVFYLIYSGFKLIVHSDLTVESANLGTLEEVKNVRGVIIRDEKVLTANKDGNVNYYYQEGDNVKKNSAVAAIKNKQEYEKINKDISSLDNEILDVQNERKDISFYQKDINILNDQIKKQVKNYYNSLNPDDLTQIYQLKSEINKNINLRKQLLSNEKTDTLKDFIEKKGMYEKQLNNNISYINTPVSGIVSYYIDGMEDTFTIANLESLTKPQMLRNYNSLEEKNKENVSLNQPIIKIVNNYDWYVACILNKGDADALNSGLTRIRFSTLSDKVISAKVNTVKPLKNESLVVFEITENIDGFEKYRALPIQILGKTAKGIKIPMTSVSEKNFFKIPENFIVKSTDNKKSGINRVDGNKTVFIPLDIEYEDENYAYIIKENAPISINDTLIMLKDNKTTNYTIKDTVSLKGVYVLTAGIKSFKQINVLASNNDYAIIDPKVYNTVRLYDNIISDVKSLDNVKK